MHIISNYLAQTPEQERKAQISKVHSLQSVRFVSPFYQLAFFPPCCHFWRILSSHSERGWIYFKNKAKRSTGSTENTQVGSEFSWENQVLTRALQKTESLESAFWSDFQGLEKRKTKGISGSSHCHRHRRLLGMRLDYKSGNQRNQPIFSFFLHLEENSYPDLNYPATRDTGCLFWEKAPSQSKESARIPGTNS